MPSWAACHYCELIHFVDRRYRVKPAKHDLESSVPRCDLHWRFVCDSCGRSHHFNGMSWCATTKRFLCISCAPSHRAVFRAFWRWDYYYALGCPYCRKRHPALDRLEYERGHPWQRSPSMRRAKRGLSPEEEIVPPWHHSLIADPDDVTDRLIQAEWDALADWWTSRYSDRGDLSREYVIDPALFRILGKVNGLRILDAGCGNGYLSRILASRGAKVLGMDISRRFIGIAQSQESGNPLGIEYRQGSIVNLKALPDRRFDLVVSNLVLQDVKDYQEAIRQVARVLRKGGRFVFSIVHPAFASPPIRGWVQEPRDSNRNEDRLYVKVDRYFERAAERWGFGDLPTSTSFHRPLRDYFHALADAGFLVRRLEEPIPTEEAMTERPRDFLHEYDRVPTFLILEAVRT